MKKMQRCLLICALLMLIGASIRPAMSYFTTFVTAKGGYFVSLQETSEIHETAQGLTKSIVIQNTDEKVPVYVRATAYAGNGYEPVFTEGDGWVPEEIDGQTWYYYTNILEPGQSTASALVVTVSTPKVVVNEKEAVNFDDINVVVVYESAPVIYDDGKPLDYNADAIWDQEVTTDKQEGGTK